MSKYKGIRSILPFLTMMMISDDTFGEMYKTDKVDKNELLREYELIKQKKSKLGKVDRDKVVMWVKNNIQEQSK
jgi:hypothetical protein